MGLASEMAVQRCSLPPCSLARPLRLRIASGKQSDTIGKTMSVKCAFVSIVGPINIVRVLCVGPVQQDVILGMP